MAEGDGLLNGSPPLDHPRFSQQIPLFQSLRRSSDLAPVGSGYAVLARRRDNRRDSSAMCLSEVCIQISDTRFSRGQSGAWPHHHVACCSSRTSHVGAVPARGHCAVSLCIGAVDENRLDVDDRRAIDRTWSSPSGTRRTPQARIRGASTQDGTPSGFVTTGPGAQDTGLICSLHD